MSISKNMMLRAKRVAATCRLRPQQLFTALFVCNVAFLVYPAVFETMDSSRKEELKESVSSFANQATVQSIFGNNAVIALFGMIPILGVPLMWQVMLNTGRAFLALEVSPVTLAINPVAWLELAAYALSAFYSVKFTYNFSKCRFQETFEQAKTVVFAVFVLLFAAAILEILLIKGGI